MRTELPTSIINQQKQQQIHSRETIELAIEGGAKVIVCPGYLFEEPIYNMQTAHPDVKFILIDGEPHDADNNYETADNTMAVLYQEDQAGFLAGYAAVKDGYTKLGFMGGMHFRLLSVMVTDILQVLTTQQKSLALM